MKENLTDAMGSSLAAVVQECHVRQSITIVHMATTLQDLAKDPQQISD